ncbi:hypothetical protein CHS0354_030551 [Potamilus streckersoni]|uniref:Uncharacterized protein n=1 Tax=Potamilus streckersoni TaxID=2493646 RepID=A0AAE0RPQ9_9BIVA|nr:hypothetical protein CHS0354_030551 [Potamilus streckersoni]
MGTSYTAVNSLIPFVLGIIFSVADASIHSLQPPSDKDISSTCEVLLANDALFHQMSKQAVMHIFHVHMSNYSEDPLYTDVSKNYKPWQWYRTNSVHGQTLLTLSFNYDILSMTVLTIGIQTLDVYLTDKPFGCFGNLTSQERVDILREQSFDSFRIVSTEKTETKLDRKHENIYVCHAIVESQGDHAEFANNCCSKDSDGNWLCSKQEEKFWITVLYVCIALVKVAMFLFGPLLLPSQLYTAAYVASEYVVKLQKDLKMKLFISESTQTSIRCKTRLALEEISDWKQFRECIEKLPKEQIVHVKVPELRIKVKGKRIIPEDDPPTGLIRTLYDNMMRCKMKALDPFSECCDRSIYASFAPHFRHKCTWHMCVKWLIKVLMLLLIPLPFYIRIVIYYKFEMEELSNRRSVIEKLGLRNTFNMYRENVVQYFIPTHPIFLVTYAFYFLSGLLIGFSGPCLREKLKSIAMAALSDMENVNRTSVLQVILRISLWPFRKCGLLALVFGPLYAVFAMPVCAVIIAIYCIPTIYLSYRLMYHSRKKLGQNMESGSSNQSSERPETIKKIHKKLTSMDQNVHRRGQSSFDFDDRYSLCCSGNGQFCAFSRLLLQITVGLFCLTVMFATVLIFTEATGLCVEVMAFTMMGIIVNAGSTLRYVTMALLVLVYMHNCYDNVYENYLIFNKTIIEEITEKVEDLKKIASLPSSMQENAAFQVKPIEAVDEIPTTLSMEKKEPRWKIGHLLLFLDSYDTPRIPLKLFKKFCEIRVHGAPGPVYINLLRATGKFSIIVVFLFFVMLVVMAFGSTHQISSTNQTLATLAGGFVPMLLKNVLSSKSVRLNLKTLSFKGQIDEIVAEFKQYWPVNDFVVEQYDPAEEAAREAEQKAKEEEDDKELEKERNKEKGTVKDEFGKEKGESKEIATNNDKTNKNDKDKEKTVTKNSQISSGHQKTDRINGEYGNHVNVIIDEDGNVMRDTVTSRVDRTSVSSPSSQHGLQTRKRPSITQSDDDDVDLIIDLGMGDVENIWQVYGTTESIPSLTMTHITVS